MASRSDCSLGAATSHSGVGYEPTVVVRILGEWLALGGMGKLIKLIKLNESIELMKEGKLKVTRVAWLHGYMSAREFGHLNACNKGHGG